MHRLLSLRRAPEGACPAFLLLSPRPVSRAGVSWPLRLLGRRRRPGVPALVAAITTAGFALLLGGGCIAPAAWADPAKATGKLDVTVEFPNVGAFPNSVVRFGPPLLNQEPSRNRFGSGKIDDPGTIKDDRPETFVLGLSLGESKVSSGPEDGFAEVIAAGTTRDVSVTNRGGTEMVFTFSGKYATRLTAEAGPNEKAEAVASFSLLQDGTAIFTVPSGSQPPLQVVNNGSLTINDGMFKTAAIRLAAGATSLFRLQGNLRVTAATVPEPSAYAFAAVFGIGCVALAERGRRRKRLMSAESA